MLTNDKRSLEIFENFIIDKNLPKFKRKQITKTKTNIFVLCTDTNLPTDDVS